MSTEATPNTPGETEIRDILRQIDLDVAELLRDGKLAAARYTLPGGATLDRTAALQGLLGARQHYEQLLQQLPAWHTTQAEACP